LAAALPAMMVAGGVLQAFSSVQEGNAQKSAYNRQAQMDDYTATLHEARAADDIRHSKMETAAVMGEQEAGYVGGGVAQSGTVLQKLQDTAASGAWAQTKYQFGGDLGAYNSRLEATNKRFAGRLAQRQGVMGAVTGLLTTGARAGTLAIGSGGTNPSSRINTGEGGELGPNINTTRYR